MSHTLSAILLAVSSNLDNLGVGVAYGVRGRHIRIVHNLLIALVSGGGTLLSMAGGEWINDYMSEEVADVLGASVMVLIGVLNTWHAITGDTATGDPGEGNGTSWREGLALAVSLTFNNLGGGLGAGISHVSIPLTTLLTVVGSVAAIAGGQRLGRTALPMASRRTLAVASGLLIVAVGIYEYFV